MVFHASLAQLSANDILSECDHSAVNIRADGVLQVYSGGLDNNITVWDLRKGEQSMSLTGHTDSITGLSLNPDGTHLLSNAVDNSLRVWDMRPYAPANRCEKIFTGHQHNYERNLLRCSWSSDGSKVRCRYCKWLAIPCTFHSDNTTKVLVSHQQTCRDFATWF